MPSEACFEACFGAQWGNTKTNFFFCYVLVMVSHHAPVSGAAQRASNTGRQSSGLPTASERSTPGALMQKERVLRVNLLSRQK